MHQEPFSYTGLAVLVPSSHRVEAMRAELFSEAKRPDEGSKTRDPSRRGKMAIVNQAAGEPWHRFIQTAARAFRRASMFNPEPAQRLALLRAYADVRVTDWGKKSRGSFLKRHRRVRSRPSRGPIAPCYVCGADAQTRHHVIQVQHGGGNHKRNKVPRKSVV